MDTPSLSEMRHSLEKMSGLLVRVVEELAPHSVGWQDSQIRPQVLAAIEEANSLITRS